MSEERKPDAEVLTTAEAREVRRRMRKATRETMAGSDPPEIKRALRVIRRASRKLEQGNPRACVEIIMEGFGGIMFRKMMEKIQTRP